MITKDKNNRSPEGQADPLRPTPSGPHRKPPPPARLVLCALVVVYHCVAIESSEWYAAASRRDHCAVVSIVPGRASPARGGRGHASFIDDLLDTLGDTAYEDGASASATLTGSTDEGG